MIIVLCIIGALAYVAIGGFVAGLLHQEDELCMIFVWPLALILVALAAIARLPQNFGGTVRRWWRRRKRE